MVEIGKKAPINRRIGWRGWSKSVHLVVDGMRMSSPLALVTVVLHTVVWLMFLVCSLSGRLIYLGSDSIWRE